VLWWTNKCHWLGIGRQLRAGLTHFLCAVAAGTRESFFSPGGGRAGRGPGGRGRESIWESPRQI